MQFRWLPFDVIVLPSIKMHVAEFILPAKPNDLLAQTLGKPSLKINAASLSSKVGDEKIT